MEVKGKQEGYSTFHDAKVAVKSKPFKSDGVTLWYFYSLFMLVNQKIVHHITAI